MNFHEQARALEMIREDRKWYENVEAVEEALRRAYADGVRDQRDVAALMAEGKGRGGIVIEGPGATFHGVVRAIPQPDGDCRFPAEAE